MRARRHGLERVGRGEGGVIERAEGGAKGEEGRSGQIIDRFHSDDEILFQGLHLLDYRPYICREGVDFSHRGINR